MPCFKLFSKHIRIDNMESKHSQYGRPFATAVITGSDNDMSDDDDLDLSSDQFIYQRMRGYIQSGKADNRKLFIPDGPKF